MRDRGHGARVRARGARVCEYKGEGRCPRDFAKEERHEREIAMSQEIAISVINVWVGEFGRISSFARQVDGNKYTRSTEMNGNRNFNFLMEARRRRADGKAVHETGICADATQ